MSSRITFEDLYLQMAELISQRSTCLRRKVGAVIVQDNHVIATGYNGAPKGVSHCDVTGCLRMIENIPSGQMHEKCRASHAEQNAIAQCAYYGISCAGATIFITCQPCIICSKIMINAGIKEIYYVGSYPDDDSIKMLNEAGVKTVQLEKKE